MSRSLFHCQVVPSRAARAFYQVAEIKPHVSAGAVTLLGGSSKAGRRREAEPAPRAGASAGRAHVVVGGSQLSLLLPSSSQVPCSWQQPP